MYKQLYKDLVKLKLIELKDNSSMLCDNQMRNQILAIDKEKFFNIVDKISSDTEKKIIKNYLKFIIKESKTIYCDLTLYIIKKYSDKEIPFSTIEIFKLPKNSIDLDSFLKELCKKLKDLDNSYKFQRALILESYEEFFRKSFSETEGSYAALLDLADKNSYKALKKIESYNHKNIDIELEFDLHEQYLTSKKQKIR